MVIEPGLLVATQPAGASTTEHRGNVYPEVFLDQARKQLPQLRRRQRRGPDFSPAASPDSGTTRPTATGSDDGATRDKHNPHEVTPRRSSPELPIIGLPALLSLAHWCDARRLVARQGGSSCDTPEPNLSPPAPARGGGRRPPESALASPARRGPPSDAANAQSRRGPATRADSEQVGGDA